MALMRLLRQHALGHKWPEGVLGQVADVLSVCDVLSPEEADWLADAGGPWADTGD